MEGAFVVSVLINICMSWMVIRLLVMNRAKESALRSIKKTAENVLPKEKKRKVETPADTSRHRLRTKYYD